MNAQNSTEMLEKLRKLVYDEKDLMTIDDWHNVFATIKEHEAASKLKTWNEKQLLDIVSKVATDVRVNGFEAHSASHAYAAYWLENNLDENGNIINKRKAKLNGR